MATKSGASGTRPRRTRPRTPVVAGWREWVALPEMSGVALKAKLDTGARTSALHAFDLDIVDGELGPVAAFELHPVQRSGLDAVAIEAPITTFRRVRSSNGRVETRPVVTTTLRLGATEWPIDITLTSRDQMGFRMLLGRSALRRRFLVDSGRSFLIDPVEDS